MNAKYSAIFLACALALLAGCWRVKPAAAQLCLVYVAFSFLALGIAYGVGSPRLWQKRSNGTLHPFSLFLLAPLHALNWLALLLAVARETERPFHEIVPNLWLGRRLIGAEANPFAQKRDVAILDLTGEFPENPRLRNRIYLCLPVLDHTAPGQDQITRALAFIAQHVPQRPVFVHCAAGRGRSAAIVTAWLLKQGQAETVETAIRLICAQRRVSLNARQISVLRKQFTP